MAGPQPGTKIIIAGRRLEKRELGREVLAKNVEGLPIHVEYLRYDEPNFAEAFIFAGKYIVSHRVHKAGKVALDAADWNDDGRVTFHSSKHGYLIDLKDYMKAKRAGNIAEAGRED